MAVQRGRMCEWASSATAVITSSGRRVCDMACPDICSEVASRRLTVLGAWSQVALSAWHTSGGDLLSAVALLTCAVPASTMKLPDQTGENESQEISATHARPPFNDMSNTTVTVQPGKVVRAPSELSCTIAEDGLGITELE